MKKKRNPKSYILYRNNSQITNWGWGKTSFPPLFVVFGNLEKLTSGKQSVYTIHYYLYVN